MRTSTRVPLLFALPALVALAGCEIEGTPLDEVERQPFTGGGGSTEYQPPAPQPMARSFTILHTNDEHSHLLGFGPNLDYPFLPAATETGDGVATTTAALGKIMAGLQTEGGFARRDYLLNKLRTEATDPVLTISAGDSTMGTLFHVAGTEVAPDWLAMSLAGYDYMTLGNHEFDFGPDALALTIRAANNLTFGGMPEIIASNIHFDDVQAGGPGYLLSTQYGEGASGALIQPWDVKVLANGLKVGLLGTLGYSAALVAAGKAPISFSVPTDGDACTDSSTCAGLQCVQGHCVNPLDDVGHVAAMAAELQPQIDALSDMVDVVVLISHNGTAEDMAIANLTTGIDVIIGGHSHDYLPAHVIEGTSTILAQAGNYGTNLGQLAVTVAPDGTVSIDDARTTLHDVDWTLDAEIAEGAPATISPELERAVSVTLGVVAPVIQGLDQQFFPAPDEGLNLLPGADWQSILQPIVSGPSEGVLGGVPYQDHNLLHLVTDASQAALSLLYCLPDVPNPVPPDSPSLLMQAPIVVQANGVIRDSLEFTQDAQLASVADVFRVLPLGASPYEAQSVRYPGFPLVTFQLFAAEMLPALEIGVTRGLMSDDFFLSYAGAQVSYDTRRTPLAQGGPGVVTKIAFGTDAGYDWVVYDADRTFAWQLADGTPFDPTKRLVTVVTNLYIAGFMEAFGLAPRGLLNPQDSIPLEDTVLCWTDLPANCAGKFPSNFIMPCKFASGGVVPWEIPEVKEWQVLLLYLTNSQALNGSVPSIYAGTSPLVPRVVDVTP